MIKAPYNFVPLSEHVFLPEDSWAAKVSHDVPFGDGISGKLECTIEALSPIYIRNGGDWTRDQIKNDPMAQSFFEVDGKFIIPGSSLRGMLRNVLEIASFGKLGRTRTDNRRYGFRDLYNQKYTKEMTDELQPGVYQSKVMGAWLRQDERGAWYLKPCEYARVNHDILIDYYKTKYTKTLDLKSRQSAEDKYKQWGEDKVNITFDYKEKEYQHSKVKLVYKKVNSLPGEGHTGALVFTGQAQQNDGSDGQKKFEFIFIDADSPEYELSEKLRDEFEFVHMQNSEPVQSWKFWKSKLQDRLRIPVFYLGDPCDPDSLGLAQMYRLPYKYSVLNAVEHTSQLHLSDCPDLSDLLFGYVNSSQDSLKGRVFIGHAEASGTPRCTGTEHTILSATEPTYYPNYLEQPENKAQRYKTFMDDDSKIRGWKRYPAREQLTPLTPVEPDQHNVDTKFIPLEKGTLFKFAIRFHNFKPCELGALIWGLTWGAGQSTAIAWAWASPLASGRSKSPCMT